MGLVATSPRCVHLWFTPPRFPIPGAPRVPVVNSSQTRFPYFSHENCQPNRGCFAWRVHFFVPFVCFVVHPLQRIRQSNVGVRSQTSEVSRRFGLSASESERRSAPSVRSAVRRYLEPCEDYKDGRNGATPARRRPPCRTRPSAGSRGLGSCKCVFRG